MQIENIIFDLGGVLIDWNPRYLYRKIFETEKEIDYFLDNIATFDWNEMQDGGRSLHEATEVLVEEYPDYEPAIRSYYGRWQEMLGGAIWENVEILKSLHQQNGHGLFALTNWSAETFPKAMELYDFLHLFEGIVVSGVEKVKKPDPEIYLILFDRYRILPEKSLFIDDNKRNVLAAREMGLNTIHLHPEANLEKELQSHF